MVVWRPRASSSRIARVAISATPASVGQLKLAPNAQLVIAGIEKEIGLDKLGVSLDTVINAIIDPMGKDNDKLNAALEKKIGMESKLTHCSLSAHRTLGAGRNRPVQRRYGWCSSRQKASSRN